MVGLPAQLQRAIAEVPPAGDQNNASRTKTNGADYPYHWGQGTNRHLDTIIQPLGNNGEVHPPPIRLGRRSAKRLAKRRKGLQALFVGQVNQVQEKKRSGRGRRARQCLFSGRSPAGSACMQGGVRKNLKRCYR